MDWRKQRIWAFTIFGLHSRFDKQKLKIDLQTFYWTDQSHRSNNDCIILHSYTNTDSCDAKFQKKIYSVHIVRAVMLIKHLQAYFMGNIVRKYLCDQLLWKDKLKNIKKNRKKVPLKIYNNQIKIE